MSVAGPAPRRYRRLRLSDQAGVSSASIYRCACSSARAKAAARGLTNVEFRIGDMTSSGYPDQSFDAVISVFSVFFVPDMEGLVGELWRLVRPGGKLAVTTWGPRIFEPAYSRWQAVIKRERPDLYSAFNPWDRITE